MALEFSDVTSGSGISYVQGPASEGLPPQLPKSGGAAAGDFDGDGWVDLYVTRTNASNLLYRNKGNGTFEDVTDAAFGAEHLASSMSNGCGWADIDNDGDLDLYVVGMEARVHHLFINDGSGKFTEEGEARGVALRNNTYKLFGNSVSFGDFDLDGFLDLHVTEWRMKYQGSRDYNRLLRNKGAEAPGYFEDVTGDAGVAMSDVAPRNEVLMVCGYGSSFSDLDRDRYPELLVSADSGTSRLFWNDHDGGFSDGTADAGTGSDRYGMGTALGDFDGDGDLDWFVTSIYDQSEEERYDGNRLFRYDGQRRFTDRTDAAGVRDGSWGWAATFCDFDHDRDLDLVQSNGVDSLVRDGFEDDRIRLWENNGSGAFTDVAGESSGVVDTGEGKGLLRFDYDNDGDMDLFVVNNGAGPVLYRNDTESGDWLKIRTVGTRSNRQGVGSFVTIVAEAGQNPLVRELRAGSNCFAQDEVVVHFGLGDLDSASVESLTVEWPSGVSQRLDGVAKNQLLVIGEPPFIAELESTPDGQFSLIWNGVTGGSYRVERRAELGAGEWEEVTELRLEQPGGIWMLGEPAGRMFYRVVLVE